jgi:hypothetical protein
VRPLPRILTTKFRSKERTVSTGEALPQRSCTIRRPQVGILRRSSKKTSWAMLRGRPERGGNHAGPNPTSPQVGEAGANRGGRYAVERAWACSGARVRPSARLPSAADCAVALARALAASAPDRLGPVRLCRLLVGGDLRGAVLGRVPSRSDRSEATLPKTALEVGCRLPRWSPRLASGGDGC